jgi:hypothetical protein
MADHSTHLPAELQARVTAAKATVTDYQTEVDRYLAGSGPIPQWADWAPRLASQLLMLTDEVDASGDHAGVVQRGGQWISGPSNG